MTDERRLVSRIRIRASSERVWRELTKDDEPQAAVFNAWLHAQAMVPRDHSDAHRRGGTCRVGASSVDPHDASRRRPFTHTTIRMHGVYELAATATRRLDADRRNLHWHARRGECHGRDLSSRH